MNTQPNDDPKHSFICATQENEGECNCEGIPYNQIDHLHCFQQENPPCGIKEKHRCCLCEKPIPQEDEDEKTWEESFDFDFTLFGEGKDFVNYILPSTIKSFIKEVEAKAYSHGKAVGVFEEGERFSEICKVGKERMREELKQKIKILPENMNVWDDMMDKARKETLIAHPEYSHSRKMYRSFMKRFVPKIKEYLFRVNN